MNTMYVSSAEEDYSGVVELKFRAIVKGSAGGNGIPQERTRRGVCFC